MSGKMLMFGSLVMMMMLTGVEAECGCNKYVVEHKGKSHDVTPFEIKGSVKSFLDYRKSSVHTGYERPYGAVTFLVYEEGKFDRVYMVQVFNKDQPRIKGSLRVKGRFEVPKDTLIEHKDDKKDVIDKISSEGVVIGMWKKVVRKTDGVTLNLNTCTPWTLNLKFSTNQAKFLREQRVYTSETEYVEDAFGGTMMLRQIPDPKACFKGATAAPTPAPVPVPAPAVSSRSSSVSLNGQTLPSQKVEEGSEGWEVKDGEKTKLSKLPLFATKEGVVLSALGSQTGTAAGAVIKLSCGEETEGCSFFLSLRKQCNRCGEKTNGGLPKLLVESGDWVVGSCAPKFSLGGEDDFEMVTYERTVGAGETVELPETTGPLQHFAIFQSATVVSDWCPKSSGSLPVLVKVDAKDAECKCLPLSSN